jgi:hypothetical protein
MSELGHGRADRVDSAAEPRQNIEARQSLPARPVRAGGLVVLIRPQSWGRYGLRPWIEAAKKRLHHNVLAIALASKLARISGQCWRMPLVRAPPTL